MKPVLFTTGCLIIWSCNLGKVEGVSCKKCDDVDQPGNCRVSITCGGGEICSTEEYNDVDGQRAYRLGCANAARCRLFLNAQTLFGKRETSPQCYECCGKDECNANLCQRSGGHVTTISPLPDHHSCPTEVIDSSGCPELFVPFKDKCYFMGPSSVEWKTAMKFCRRHGGNLVSVNSKEEHDFLKSLGNLINASFIGAYWTGGYYSLAAGEFQYVDGSSFSYSDWYGSPPASFSSNNLHYVALYNPANSSTYSDYPMHVFNTYTRNGIICESNKD